MARPSKAPTIIKCAPTAAGEWLVVLSDGRSAKSSRALSPGQRVTINNGRVEL